MTLARLPRLIALLPCLAACVPTTVPSSAPGPSPTAATVPEPVDWVGDVDALCQQVEEGYAYWDALAIDWGAACDDSRQRARSTEDPAVFLSILEDLIEELYDDHVHLGLNNEHSPRLVPSHLAIWAELREGRAIITAVRPGSWAQRSGIVAGTEITTIDGQPVAAALAAHLPTHRTREDPRATQWALRRAIVGSHDHAPALGLAEPAGPRTITRPTTTPPTSDDASGPLEVGTPAPGIGHVRLANSLGEPETVPAFDAALAEHPDWTALILDLRDTPGGGNTTIARGLMGRLISTEAAYQRHELPAETRAYGIGRAWLELVVPRGPTFTGPVVVLVGRWTGSMGEGTAIGLQGMGRATLVGTRMAGLAGAVYQIELPNSGWSVAFPVESLFHVDGTPRHHVVPDVELDLATATGPDPVLYAALAWLRRAPSPSAREGS